MSISGISGSGSSDYAYLATTANATTNTVSNAASIANSPFAGLNLTQSQSQSISNSLQQLQSGQISQSQAQTDINSVLTPSQQTQLQQNLQSHHGRHHHGQGGGSNTSSSSSSSTSGTDEYGIPTSSQPASDAISNLATTFWVQSQTNEG